MATFGRLRSAAPPGHALRPLRKATRSASRAEQTTPLPAFDDVVDHLLAFDGVRSFPGLAAAIHRGHVGLRTAVLVTTDESEGSGTWCVAAVEDAELRAAVARAEAALAYLAGDSASLDDDESAASRRAALESDLVTYVTLPLVAESDVVGVVQVGCPAPPCAAAVAFFDTLARRLSFVTCRARRDRAMREERARVETVAKQAHLPGRGAAPDSGESVSSDLVREASSILASSVVEISASLENVVRLVAQRAGGGCAIDVVEGESSSRFVHAAATTPDAVGAALDRLVPGVMLDGAPIFSAADEDRAASTAWAARGRGRLGLARIVAESAAAARADLRAAWLASLPLRDRGGQAVGALTLFGSDGSRRPLSREACAELAACIGVRVSDAAAYNEARRALRRRDDVLAMVSHDLRGPLSTVLLSAERLLATIPAAERRTAGRAEVSAIQRAARRASRLVEDLLDSTELAQGRLRLERASVEVPGLVADVVSASEERAARANLRLSVTIAPALGHAYVDGYRIAQVLANLIDNAVKFSAPGGEVRIHAARSESELVIAVSDDGAGIPAGELSQIFTRYWRGSRRGGGLGLGLSIAREIATAHGGHIEVESVVGRGTTVRLRLASACPPAAELLRSRARTPGNR